MHKKMRIKGELLLREIAGEFVLVPVGETALRIKGMICLSESGALIWKRLQTGATREELLQKLQDNYEIDADTAKSDLESFLQSMTALDLLQETDYE